jgi:hypothetical protein
MVMKTQVTSAKGVNSTKGDEGFQIEKNTGNYGFLPYKAESLTAKTTSATLLGGEAGALTLSGTSALTMVMPLASGVPMSMWTFRNLSEGKQHILTGSQEAGGTTVFHDAVSQGSKLTMSGAIGTAVTLLCDGKNFMVLGCTMSGVASQGPAYTISAA